MAAEKILLGYGTVTVGGVPLGLTRGGSVFTVEREYRPIEADGDMGPVVGRIAIDREVGKLTVNALELFTAANLSSYYPGLSLATGTGEDTLTSTLVVAAGDHKDIIWTGKTLDGKSVVIEVDDALNLANLEWGLEDKSEVVPSIEFTAHYAEGAPVAPWRVKFQNGASYTVTFTVTASAVAKENASINFYGQTKLTSALGVAAFTYTPTGINRPFSVTLGGYQTYFGAVTVDAAEAVAVALTAI